ncbi:MAG: hypothetical protein ABW189_06835 [Rickettsiales bacterium]
MVALPSDFPLDFYRCPTLRRLCETLGGAESARFVGGAVRDRALGLRATDIDVAVAFPFDDVARLLRRAGYALKETGRKQGSLTVALDGPFYPYAQVTSLRRDVACHGRGAEVEYTDDWQGDAVRRDFTINALYLDASGALYDYTEGSADLAAGLLKTIGEPETRFRQDYLRVLRLFRFYACLPTPRVDASTLNAAYLCADGVNNLSAFRKREEMGRLAQGSYAERALEALYANSALKNALALPGDVYPKAHMRRYLARLAARGEKTSLYGTLAALFLACGRNAPDPADAYVESKKDRAAWRFVAYGEGRAPNAHLAAVASCA